MQREFKVFSIAFVNGEKIIKELVSEKHHIIVGRSPEVDIPILDERLSRKHLELFVKDGKIFVQDLGSTNGSAIGSRKLTGEKAVEIQSGERIRLAAVPGELVINVSWKGEPIVKGVPTKEPLKTIPEVPLKALDGRLNLVQKALLAAQNSPPPLMEDEADISVETSRAAVEASENSILFLEPDENSSVGAPLEEDLGDEDPQEVPPALPEALPEEAAQDLAADRSRSSRDENTEVLDLPAPPPPSPRGRPLPKARAVEHDEPITQTKTPPPPPRVIPEKMKRDWLDSEEAVLRAKKYAEEIESQAEASAATLLDDAEANATARLEGSETKATALLADAEVKSAALLDGAEARLESIQKSVSAQQTALDEGAEALLAIVGQKEKLQQEIDQLKSQQKQREKDFQHHSKQLEAEEKSFVDKVEAVKNKKLQLDQDLKELRVKIGENREEVETQTERLKELKSSFEDTQAREEELRESLAELNHEFLEIENKKHSSEKEIQALQGQSSGLQKDIASLEAKQEKYTLQANEQEELYKRSKAHYENLRKEMILEDKKRRAEVESVKLDLEIETKKVVLQRQDLENQKNLLDRELKVLNSEKTEIEKSLARARAELTKIEHERENSLGVLERAIAGVRESEDRLRAIQKDSEDKTSSLHQTLAQLEAEASTKQGLIKEFEKRISENKTIADKVLADGRLALQREKQQLAQAAEAELSDKKKRIDDEVAGAVAKAQKQSAAILDEAEAEAQKIVAQAQESFEMRKKELEGELRKRAESFEMELSTKSGRSIEEMESRRKELENEFAQKDAHRVSEIVENVKVIASAWEGRFQQEKSIKVNLTGFAHDVRDLTRKVILNEDSPADSRLRAYSLVDASALQSKKRFYKFIGGAVTVPLALLALYLGVPKLVKNAVESAKQENKMDDAFLAKIQAAKSQKPKFNPAQTREFRESYTMNLVYLEGYAEMKSDPKVSDRWTVELNNYFINDLKRGDRIIGEFIAAENTMLRELNKQREAINPQFVETGIQRMKDVEAVSVVKLQDLAGTLRNYEKVRRFEKSFYEKYLSAKPSADSPELRSPASETPADSPAN